MMNYRFLFILCFSVFVFCCHNNDNIDEDSLKVATPVTITGIENASVSENININAVSAYQKKNIIKSNINGYIEKGYVNIGDFVQAGKVLYTLKTKEADALSNLSRNDSTFTFNGEMNIKAPSTGIITELTKLTGDYVNDGDQLCTIAEQNSFVFLLNVPFEQTKYIKTGNSCTLLLPDSSHIEGTITSKLSSVDPVSQTQSYVIILKTNRLLPENLLAIVRISKNSKQNAQVLDKNCILTNETMNEFWIMKLINDTTAVRVNIVKGISGENKIEILSPRFSKADRIINSGNYGLPDTVYVSIK
jgi:biotin carboxyl carrier protein